MEIIANETQELIAEWLTSRFLQLTVRKCGAILVKRRRKYEALRFEVNGELIPLKKEIKDLGVCSFKHASKPQRRRR